MYTIKIQYDGLQEVYAGTLQEACTASIALLNQYPPYIWWILCPIDENLKTENAPTFLVKFDNNHNLTFSHTENSRDDFIYFLDSLIKFTLGKFKN